VSYLSSSRGGVYSGRTVVTPPTENPWTNADAHWPSRWPGLAPSGRMRRFVALLVLAASGCAPSSMPRPVSHQATHRRRRNDRRVPSAPRGEGRLRDRLPITRADGRYAVRASRHRRRDHRRLGHSALRPGHDHANGDVHPDDRARVRRAERDEPGSEPDPAMDNGAGLEQPGRAQRVPSPPGDIRS